ncbi:MAG TPA: hypothetical protein VFK03_01980 [Candidatus Saccharimonadales bacterium]|nr:hypothetical protein [Candidatus Saccharimonadales bacterium]
MREVRIVVRPRSQVQRDIANTEYALKNAEQAREEALRVGDTRAIARGDQNVAAAESQLRRLRQELGRTR